MRQGFLQGEDRALHVSVEVLVEFLFGYLLKTGGLPDGSVGITISSLPFSAFTAE
jgi:hypothetical protein